jgi:hypothetical protein
MNHLGARGGTRTHTPFRTTDFESVASAIPPLGPGAEERIGERHLPTYLVVTVAQACSRLRFFHHARVHVPRPRLSASRYGASLGRP